jgi:hypothetical protein
MGGCCGHDRKSDADVTPGELATLGPLAYTNADLNQFKDAE